MLDFPPKLRRPSLEPSDNVPVWHLQALNITASGRATKYLPLCSEAGVLLNGRLRIPCLRSTSRVYPLRSFT